MNIGRNDWPLLLVGDVAALILSLYVTLLVRYVAIPSWDLFYKHLVPFSILFALSILIFFIAGLYQKQTSLFKRELPGTIMAAQAVNVVLAALFFFFLPYFGIAPKTNLFIYLIISSIVVALWRLHLSPLLDFRKETRAIIIGSGKELEELVEELKHNNRYKMTCVEVVDVAKVQNANDIQQQVLKRIVGGDASAIIADTHGAHSDVLVPLFYNLTFVQSEVQVINFGKLYEEIFDKVALSQLSHDWLLEHTATSRETLYSAAKRFVDIILSVIILFVLIVVTPFVFVAIRLEGNGPLFIQQERIGRNGKKIFIRKFRTMTANEDGAWIGETKNQVTRVGAFLRRTSIDELPQVLAVLRGDISFIGPRSDVCGLAERLADAIPFYNARYKITPGISGWAQINQRYTPGKISPQSIEDSRVRLAYDLYYVKHRSLFLDLSIAFRTIKTLILRFIPHGKKR